MKKITSLMLALMMLLSFAVTAHAADTATKNGISATIATNVDAYFEDEAVTVTITVKNNNSNAVKDVAVETLLPAYLRAGKGQNTNSKFNLAAGETKTIRLEVFADRPSDLPPYGYEGHRGNKAPDKNANEYNDLEGDGCLPTEECKKHNDCAGDECLPTDECNKDKECDKKKDTCKGDGTCPEDCYCNQPDTGDGFNAFLWIAVLMFAVAAGVLVLKGNKKAIKTMCLAFCVLMVLAVVPVDTFAANDAIVVDKTIQIGYYEYTIKAKVSFNGGSSNGVGDAPVTMAPTTAAPAEDWEEDLTFAPDLDEEFEEDYTVPVDGPRPAVTAPVETTAPLTTQAPDFEVETTASMLDSGLSAFADVISGMTEDGTVDKFIEMLK